MNPSLEKYFNIWRSVQSYSSKYSYKGFNKHDGLNSLITNFFFGRGKWLRIFAIQIVMRAPVNIRPLLLVRKAENPKGLSLFLRSLLNIYELNRDPELANEIESLVDRIKKLRSSANNGTAWGYQYPWQDLGFYAPSGTPNAVVTSFVCNSLIHAYEVLKKESYLESIENCLEFYFNDLRTLKLTEDELCLSYMPVSMDMRVMDVSILIGSVVAKYNRITGCSRYQNESKKLVNYVIKQQTDYGAWYYTDPPSDSLITHDNYHTGFILDALWDYMHYSSDFSYMDNYKKGLKYYADNLFTNNGAPKWMNDKTYPFDIHGAAQGIITFSRHNNEYPHLTNKIFNWTVENLYSNKGYFYYQKNRFFTKKFTLMRWCNAWMSFATSCAIKNQIETSEK